MVTGTMVVIAGAVFVGALRMMFGTMRVMRVIVPAMMGVRLLIRVERNPTSKTDEEC